MGFTGALSPVIRHGPTPVTKAGHVLVRPRFGSEGTPGANHGLPRSCAYPTRPSSSQSHESEKSEPRVRGFGWGPPWSTGWSAIPQMGQSPGLSRAADGVARGRCVCSAPSDIGKAREHLDQLGELLVTILGAVAADRTGYAGLGVPRRPPVRRSSADGGEPVPGFRAPSPYPRLVSGKVQIRVPTQLARAVDIETKGRLR
jgi:hypothetical protein